MPRPKSEYGLETLAIHAGTPPDPVTGARSFPIYQSTSYVFEDADHAASLFNLQTPGFIYSRLTNPTVAALEERLAAGVRVVLGTDSRASTPDLDLLAEIRAAAEEHPGVSPGQLLPMVTSDAAEALGLAGEVGQLAAGQRANLVVVAADYSSRQEVEAAICAPGSCLVGVMVGGRWSRQMA